DRRSRALTAYVVRLRSMRPVQLALILLLLIGCSKPIKSLAGVWSSRSEDTKTELWLASDGTFILAAGNSFAFGGLEGNYRQSSDTLTLNYRVLGVRYGPTTAYVIHYRWTGPDTISTYDVD